MDDYLAHLRKGENGEEIGQTVQEHCRGTAQRAAEFARPFDAGEEAELAGLLHDIGKYSKAFQRRLRGGPRVDHSTAGAVECFRLGHPSAAFSVAGHHAGLPDGGGQGDSPNGDTFFARMNRMRAGLLEDYSAWKSELTPPAIAPKPPDSRLPELMFLTRMIYSCLVDADFLDTEAFMQGKPREAAGTDSVEALWDKLERFISGWFPPKGAINAQRCAILSRCIEEGKRQPQGLFTLTVPTGGGKTVASLAFALAHAKARGLRRVVYVIPYTSIIEQTADQFRRILGEENVLEHHSNVLFEIEEEADPYAVRLARATENWDAPVIVTTAVQFFESLYACRSSQCRKLHNLAGSVILFDEAQMLPLAHLRPCVFAISQLIRQCRASVVLCTATQPALEPLFREMLPDQEPVELCPPESFSWDAFRRVVFQMAGRLSWDELAGRLNGCRQALCIVNTRKSAQEVFARLEGEGCFHLSTLMCPAHRRAQLEEIRRRLRLKLPCRVVSTSLIEAGVDVDFPAVFRELAGIDSILQAAGRCNREGRNAAEESAVTVFESEARLPPLFATAAGVGRELLLHGADLAARDTVRLYFRGLLDVRGQEAQDVSRIMALMKNDLFPFRTVAERFHLIDSQTKTVYLPLGEGGELVSRLRAGERSRGLFRRLGQYGVSVYPGHFAALEQAGDLELLEDGSAILVNLPLYSEKTGLSLEADEGKALFV